MGTGGNLAGDRAMRSNKEASQPIGERMETISKPR